MHEQSSPPPKHDEPLPNNPPSPPLQKQSKTKIQIILLPDPERCEEHPQFVATKSLIL